MIDLDYAFTGAPGTAILVSRKQLDILDPEEALARKWPTKNLEVPEQRCAAAGLIFGKDHDIGFVGHDERGKGVPRARGCGYNGR